jgi:Zn-dependent peptidase ImmA (M78 family)
VFNGIEWDLFLVSPTHSQLDMGNGRFALGVCDDDLKAIYINKELKPYYLKQALAHELTHAAAFSYGEKLTREEHEYLADFIVSHGENIVDITDDIMKKKGI